MKAILRLLGLYAPLMPWLAASVVIGAVTTLASIGLMAVSGWFITAMAAAGLAGVLMNYFTPAAIVRGLAILRTGGRYVERLVSHEATLRLSASTRTYLFARLAPLAPAALEETRSGDLLARLKNDIDRIELMFLRLVSPLAVAAIALAVVAYVLSCYDATIAAAASAVLVGGGLLVPALAALATRRAGAAVTEHSAALKRAVVDDVEKLGALIVTGAAAHHRRSLETRHAAMLSAETRVARIGAAGQAIAGLSGDLAMLAVLTIGIALVRTGALAGADLTMVALLSLSAAEALMGLPAAFSSLPSTGASAQRLFALIDRKPAVTDPTDPAPLPSGHAISFEGVHLAYRDGGREALAGIDLDITAGRRIAIVGASGAGKSSIADLLVRARDPSAGAIRLDGVRYDLLRLDDLRGRVALVPQKPHIFTASLGDNLRFVRPQATDAELIAALHDAGLSPLLERLPAGLSTPVGIAGSTLSGGEGRRLALARALLADAPVLVLDEPGEGLDPELEREIMGRLLHRADGRTVILFTHGSAGLADVDEIVEIADGRLIGHRHVAQAGDRRTAS